MARVMTSTSVGKHPTAFTATGLPILRIALDIERMSPVILPMLAAALAGEPDLRLTYARLLAYKQGNRGTIRYDVLVGGRPVAVLGKLYPQPAQVERVGAILRGLHDDAFAAAPGLDVPTPLGSSPELSMLLYLPVEGIALDEALLGDDRTGAVHRPGEGDAMRRTAAWLATLHAAPLPLDRRWEAMTEVVNLRAWVALIGQVLPDEAARAEELAEDLARSAGHVGDDTSAVQDGSAAHDPAAIHDLAAVHDLAPIHKDFHYKHVLVQGGVSVIDFDEVRLGDPMYDVAHFCAHLRLLATRHPEHVVALAAAEGAFLHSYTQRSGRPLTEGFPWYAAHTCLKIVKQLCTVRGVRPHPDGAERRRQVSAMLDQGLGFRGLLG